MHSKFIVLILTSVGLTGCKELNEINWPEPVRAQLVKYNIVEPKVDSTLTKEVQTVPIPEVGQGANGENDSSPINLPELPVQKMGDTGPIFEQSVTTGDDALKSLQGTGDPSLTSTSTDNPVAVAAPTAPPNVFGTPIQPSQQ